MVGMTNEATTTAALHTAVREIAATSHHGGWLLAGRLLDDERATRKRRLQAS